MPEIELSAGTVEYTDTRGSGETVVLLHGLAFDESVWDRVVDGLRSDFRVVVPVLPMGSHRRPMRPDADLSAQGVADILGEFLERLDLRDVTLVQNDAGTAQLLVGVRDERVHRLVLTSCEALENYPPGVQGRTLKALSRVPGGIFLLLQSFRVPFLVRLPNSLGGMAERPIPYELVRLVRAPAHGPADPAGLHRVPAQHAGGHLHAGGAAAARLPRSGARRVGAEDRMMPHETGRRLAALLPRGEYVEIPGARTLVPLDNPEGLCAELRRFIKESPGPRRQDPAG